MTLHKSLGCKKRTLLDTGNHDLLAATTLDDDDDDQDHNDEEEHGQCPLDMIILMIMTTML